VKASIWVTIFITNNEGYFEAYGYRNLSIIYLCILNPNPYDTSVSIQLIYDALRSYIP